MSTAAKAARGAYAGYKGVDWRFSKGMRKYMVKYKGFGMHVFLRSGLAGSEFVVWHNKGTPSYELKRGFKKTECGSMLAAIAFVDSGKAAEVLKQMRAKR